LLVREGDHALPPAHAERMTAEGLRRLFAAPPSWTPELRREPRFMDRESAHAAVLIPLVMRDELTLILTQRTAHLSTHSSQIAFPGGKVDPEDDNPTATALREAREEIGLMADRVEVLGSLPTYVTGSAFVITPVVGLVQPDFELQPNPYEVDDVFEVPLAFLMNPAHHRRHALEFEGVVREWYSMPYQDAVGERFIWGATAGMLRNFYRLLSS
jgi:8-oxo-dGTP pyrophosphatase MutT (NUDIX family)